MGTKKTNEPIEEVKDKVIVDETNPILVDFKSYIGKDNDEIVRALIGRSDVTNHANCIITNVVDRDSDNGFMTIVVSKGLPQYVLNADTGEYELSTTRNIFTSVIAVSAILKAQGEMLLAKAIMGDNINQILAILKGARISVISHEIAAGEDFVNPFATRMPSEFTATERNRVQYFPYDVTLADKSVIMEELTLAKLLG